MKINQQYIADLLNVSRVTVTKALQDHSDIAVETRKRVKEMAEQLGYIPNNIGRSLSIERTHTLGIVVPKINHSFFSSVIEEMFKTATELGYKILLMVSFEDEVSEYESIKTLLSMNVDGILIDSASSTSSERSFNLVEKQNKPILFFDRKPRTIDSFGVYFDDYNLSYDLTTKVLEKGYSRLLYITGPQHINICYSRLKGYKQAMKEKGYSISKPTILKTGLEKKDGYNTFNLFLKTHDILPECILCVNDSLALGVYDACHEHGIKIPDDIGVAGFGNVLVSNLVNPPLTTVDLDTDKASAKAIENLINLIEKEDYVIKDETFGGVIMIRESIAEQPPISENT